MRIIYLCGTVLASVALAGCGHRLVAFRTTNPVIEDRVTAGDSDSDAPRMSIVSTRADRRTVLIVKQDRICAEPPPDVAEAVSSQAVASLATKGVGLEAGTALQTALMQLAQRSQGLEYFRTASFVYCNMFVINRQISLRQYNWYMANAAAEATKLMALQIEKNNLPSALGSLQVSNAPKLTVDAARLESAEEDKVAKTSDTATAAPPNSSPMPPPAAGDEVIPPKQ